MTTQEATAPTRSAGVRRTSRLTRTNALLMARNRLTLFYAVAMPVLPLGLLFLGDGADVTSAVSTLSTVLLMALLFPVYYNLLSMFVTRRDELVLKRLRTGEVRDLELVTSMALPGTAITVLVTVLAIPVVMVTGLRFPLNPVLLLVGVLVACVAFAAFALWTAAWTKTAEAAQLTSAPVLVLATVGLFGAVFPSSVQRWVDLLPGAAVRDLVQVAWFGRSAGLGSTSGIDFAATWAEAAPALATLVGWAAVAVLLALRSMHWEPRT
jgi:ABC-2 type transport system permease protein